MNKNRKTSHILNVFQFDANGHVILPATLTIGENPHSSDNTSKIPSTAWIRTYVTGLSYLTGNQSITVSGDATGSGTTAITLTLANTAVTPGTYGSTTLVPVVTVDSKGRITSVTTAAISGSLTFTGDVTGTGTTGTSTGLTLAASGVTAGTYTKVTVDSKGRVTVGANASTTDISEGTNLYYTDTRVGTYLTANSYATQSYVGTQIANLVASAPATLDTLNELSVALGNDPNFATSVATSIGTKQAQLNGTGFVKVIGTTVSYDNNTYLTSFTETDPTVPSHVKSITTTEKANWNTAYGWGNHASGGYLTGITSSQVTTALGYTPYNSTNPSGYITGITSSNVTTALGYTPYNSTNPNGYITGITSGNVTTALGYTPYNSTNPSGYITSSGSITGNAATSTIFNNGSLYISVTNGNTLNSGYNNAGDGSDIWINYRGYNDAQSYFRDFRVGDGKGAQVALFTGSTKSLAITGAISASNLSGTNTGDQTNISGNAATATSAAGVSFLTQPNSTWAGRLQLGGNGANSGVANIAVVQATDGNLHMDGGVGKVMYLNYYSNGIIYLNGATYYISANGSQYNGNAATATSATSATTATTVTNGVYTNSSQNNLSGILNFGSSGATPYSNPTGTSNGISFGGIESSSLRQYGIFTEQENIGGNYSKLTFNYHTGIRLGASSSYGGTRFYNDAAGNGSSTMIFSVGNGDNHVRVINNLYVGGTISASNLSGTNTGDQTNISGNSATTSQTTFGTLTINGSIFCNANNDLSTSSGGISFWSTGPITTSWIGFKNNSSTGWGYHGGATVTGGYSTYHIMDTPSRGWIWRYATPGGSNFAGTNVASIQSDTGQMALGSTWDGSASSPLFAQLNVCFGKGTATNYRDIDLKGTWAAGEGHSITATHSSASTNMVGQITFQHDSPGSRIKFGRIYHSGDQSTYPMELISSGSSANLYVTGDITAYYSDERLKLKVSGIENALQKVCSLSAFRYVDNELAKQNGYNSDKIQMGLSAQEIQRVAPEIVTLAHFDMEIKDGKQVSKSGENYLTINYGKLTPLLIEAIKEQQLQIEELKNKLDGLTR